MKLPVGAVGILMLILIITGARDIRAAQTISQVPWSAWVAVSLGFLFFGAFLTLASRES